jgi:NADH-quinone oxidoreductase subunit A
LIPLEFGRLGILLLFAIAFPAIPIVASYLFYLLKVRPQRPNPVKSDTYECGVETIGPADIQFNARYYLIALAFVIFDVEALFLFPWAVSIGAVGIAGFVAAGVFILILAFGLIYDWAKGGLEWK